MEYYMKKMIPLFSFIYLMISVVSCGEEVLTKTTQDENYSAPDVNTFSAMTCSESHFDKPPVDILYIVDNSGSTLTANFNALKESIRNTLQTISFDFDYHIYIAPLIPLPGENLSTYPLLYSNLNSFDSITNLNVHNDLNSVPVFQQVTGNNAEAGVQRSIDIINANRSNKIFRNNSHLVITLVSTEDDDSLYDVAQGVGRFLSDTKFTQAKNALLSFSKKYNQATGGITNPMNAESLRFFTIVPQTSCGTFTKAIAYRKMSQHIYTYMNYTDDSKMNTYDICSQDYAGLYNSINNSIKKVLIGHSYDFWKVSSASEADIQTDDIKVYKILSDGTRKQLSASNTNGFQYVGHRSNQNTRYAPDSGEPQTGLMVQLFGEARVNYPECIVAETRSPTEHYGYIALAVEPELSSLTLHVRGEEVSQNATNGWTYLGYREVLNIKVPGPTGTPTTPALNKTGYFIQLHGNAILGNGDQVNVYYKPASR